MLAATATGARGGLRTEATGALSAAGVFVLLEGVGAGLGDATVVLVPAPAVAVVVAVVSLAAAKNT